MDCLRKILLGESNKAVRVTCILADFFIFVQKMCIVFNVDALKYWFCSFLFCPRVPAYKSWLQFQMKGMVMKLTFMTFQAALLPLRYVQSSVMA